MQHVGIYADHVRGVGRTDVHHAIDAFLPELVRYRHSPEVDLQAHRLGQFDEDELIPPVAVARLRKLGLDAATHILLHPAFSWTVPQYYIRRIFRSIDAKRGRDTFEGEGGALGRSYDDPR